MMNTSIGILLTIWSIRTAVAFYLFRVTVDVMNRSSVRGERVARLAWTMGFGFYMVHVVCAFHFYHHWSHTQAYQHTSRVTERLVGVDWGGGLFFNYVFTLVWAADVMVWWLEKKESRTNSRRLFWPIHLIFAFMMLNATVVFGGGHWKWIAICFATTVCVLKRISQHNIRDKDYQKSMHD